MIINMTNRERVITSLNHRQPDRVPYCVTFTKVAREKMIDFYGDLDFELKLGNCFTILSSEPSWGWKEVEPGIWEDQFGVRWNRRVDKDIGVVCNRVVTKENLEDFKFPDPDDPSRFSHYNEIIEKNRDGFYVVDLGWTLFERAWTLCGMDNFLMAMVTEEDFAHSLLERITRWNLRMIDNICSYPIDAVWFGDDWGHQRGLIMGPRLWREFLKPCMRRLFERVKSHGKYVFLHSCGKVDELFPDLIESGLDVFNPFQPEAMDIYRVKREFGSKLSFWGGISTQRMLPFASTQEVRDEIKRLLDYMGEGGGYIAAPAHDIPPDARPENVAAMIEILQSQ